MHLAPLIRDLAVILAVAAGMTFLFRLLKQPVVLGYIVAGLLVGPYTPPILSVIDVESIKVWAELGVVLLMFALGLEFSFHRLIKVGVSAGVTATVQIISMILLGYLVGRAMGFNSMNAVFLGCMISISSTTIIIKSLEELGLKSRRFAELVFGILIVEDLAAIVMLVALANIATKSAVSSYDLLVTGFRLALVVGAWLVIGMFAVPRLVKAVGSRGNNEMLIVVSLGLCLSLVTVSAHFGYSVALGAFIMGSILAETKEAHQIEKLVTPLKDIFGAVFFVSVGMMLEPTILLSNLGTIAVVCLVVIVGKILTVGFGALATGQTISTSVHSAMSMAQIGEFSFIIATLGLSYNALDKSIYPVIVAVSVITTFATPYLIKYAPKLSQWVENHLPEKANNALTQYVAWIQRRSLRDGSSQDFYARLFRWIICSIVVTTIFVVSAHKLLPWVATHASRYGDEGMIAWVLTFLAASPFVWGMLTAFPLRVLTNDHKTPKRRGLVRPELELFASRMATVVLVGILSSEFMTVWITALVTISLAGLLFMTFKHRMEAYYRWFERKFVGGLSVPQESSESLASHHNHLVPWNAHLGEVLVNVGSKLAGKSLIELQLREQYAINVIVIKRGTESIIAPPANQLVFPGDILLCFGTDEDLDRFRNELSHSEKKAEDSLQDLSEFALWPIEVKPTSPFVNRSIKESQIQDQFSCMVVGMERQGKRIQSPMSSLSVHPKDLLWIVGSKHNLQNIKLVCEGN